MAWNPSPEVAAVRDAARKLDAPIAVMVYLDRSATHIRMASYGENWALCANASKLGDYLLDAAAHWDEKKPDSS